MVKYYVMDIGDRLHNAKEIPYSQIEKMDYDVLDKIENSLGTEVDGKFYCCRSPLFGVKIVLDLENDGNKIVILESIDSDYLFHTELCEAVFITREQVETYITTLKILGRFSNLTSVDWK